MSNTAPTVNLAPIIAVTESSFEKLESAIRGCRQGLRRGDRAARARYILVEEARDIVADEISRSLDFGPSELPGYLYLFEDILDINVSEGTLGSAIEFAVRRSVEEEIMNDVYPLLLNERHDRTLDALAQDIAEIRRDVLDLINGTSTRRLSTLVEEALSARDGENLMQLCEEIDRLAEEMRVLIRRLDIADPPTADYAGRARRMLLEAADFINLSVAFGNMDEFLAPRAEASP